MRLSLKQYDIESASADCTKNNDDNAFPTEETANEHYACFRIPAIGKFRDARCYPLLKRATMVALMKTIDW